MSKIGVVIPAHYEEKSLHKVIRDIHEVLKNYEYNIFVVDDGSEDDTMELESFKYLTDLYDKEIRLVMVGPVEEADKEFFYKYINNHGLVDRVSFTGQVPHEEALELMNGFKVAVSYHEGDFPFFNVAVPTKILEYMAAGCCIVTTDHKMYRNMLKPEEAIFTKQNVIDFANGLKKALEDNELNRSLRKNAKKGAYMFSFSKIADQYEDVYESIMLG